MNLRHIDPRSTDWMDAMLEGDLQKGRQRPLKRDADQDEVESEPAVLAAGASAVRTPLATSPPSGSR